MNEFTAYIGATNPLWTQETQNFIATFGVSEQTTSSRGFELREAGFQVMKPTQLRLRVR
jgi:hypothetical protein